MNQPAKVQAFADTNGIDPAEIRRRELHMANEKARAAEHTNEARIVQELVDAAQEAQAFLRELRGAGYVTNSAGDVDRIEMRLYNALYPEARRD